MTPKQRWYCFWVIIVVTVLLSAGLVWFAIHNPQASWNTLFSNLWESFVNFVSRYLKNSAPALSLDKTGALHYNGINNDGSLQKSGRSC